MTPVSAAQDKAAREAWQVMAALVLDNERRREVSEKVGLSFGKLKALRRVAARPMTMRELATALVIDPPNLTGLVDDLESAGLVERQNHPTDRRAKLVVATETGAALAHKANQILAQPPVGLRELPPEDLKTLGQILARIPRVQP
jgi:DNA-binding MarR family transcriptional regulator